MMVKENENKAISIVIPFLNESEGIETLLDQIEKYHKERKFDFEIVFVDDGSLDDTSKLIRNREGFSFPCQLLRFSRNYGSHAAIRAGFKHSTFEYSTWLPADLQISFDTIEQLSRHISSEYDIVYGVRENVQIGVFEKFFSRAYSMIMRKYVNSAFPTSGIETILMTNKVKSVINDNVEANSSIALQILDCGFKSKFIGIDKSQRSIGKSKWSFQKKVKLMLDSFLSFSYAPIRLVSIIGISFFVVGIFWSLYLVLRKLFINDLESGWPALMSILLVGFGITNIGLGIVAEYLWRTLDASRKRPVYIIDEIYTLKN